jgi:hypothetical protein
MARVFRIGIGDGFDYFACVKGGHRIELGVTTSYGNSVDVADHFRLAPPYVAWALFDANSEQLATYYVIEVVDLRSRRYVRTDLPNGESTDNGVIGIGPTVALVLTNTGGVAWIAMRYGSSPAYYEVWRSDGRGSTRLAAGAEIDPRSLKRLGHQLQWKRGTQIQHSDIT